MFGGQNVKKYYIYYINNPNDFIIYMGTFSQAIDFMYNHTNYDSVEEA